MLVELNVLKLQSAVSDEPFILLLAASGGYPNSDVQFASIAVTKKNVDLLVRYSNAVELINSSPETKDLKINCIQACGTDSIVIPEWYEQSSLEEIVEESTVPVSLLGGVHITIPSNLKQYTSPSPDYRLDVTLNAYISYSNDLIKNGYVCWEVRNTQFYETVETDPIPKKAILNLYKLFS